MALLQDLKVQKVSFVSRAANKRKFLLLKSDDSTEKNVEQPPVNNEETNPMLKEDIQKSVRLLLKAGASDEKIVETMKSEHKLNDGETKELKAALDLSRSMASDIVPAKKEDAPVVPPTPAPTAADDKKDEANDIQKQMDALKKQNADLTESIRKDTETRRKSEITLWLSDNCSHLPGDAAKMVEDIYKMEQTDREAADRLRESLKSSSDLVKSSAILVERGSSYDAHPVPSGEIIMKKVLETRDAIKKSGVAMKESDIVISAVKSLGPESYGKYRDEHIARSTGRR